MSDRIYSVAYKYIVNLFEDRIRFEHMAVLGFVLAAWVRIQDISFDIDNDWQTEFAAAYVFLGGLLVLAEIFFDVNKLVKIMSWAILGSGLLTFAVLGPAPWVYYPLTAGAVLKVRYLTKHA